MKRSLMFLLLFVPILLMAQQKKVTGKVVDNTNFPLPGVSIVIQGTTMGTITDNNGDYSLSNVPEDATLVFSFIGYDNQAISTQGKSSVNVTLKESSIGLDEVVAIGYGTVKKSDLTGAVSRMNEKTLKEKPVQNALQAVQGRAAGVDIVSNVRPGEVASIKIRGTRSINGNNDPLYVVDGIILMGSVNDINPNDIASIEILKDASATAIYGSRGANGVILVTTKQGKKGSVSVNYESSLSLDKAVSLTDWASSGEALDRYRLAAINGGTYNHQNKLYSEANPFADIQMFGGNNDESTVNAIRQGYEWNDPGTYKDVKMVDGKAVYNGDNIPTTDWIDYLTRTSRTQNHLLSLSAGNDISKLYFSFGYLDNEGTQKNQGYNRYTVKINGDITPYKWLTVGTSLSAARSTQLYGTINRSGSATGAQDAYGEALSMYVMSTPYDEQGNLIEYPGNNTTLPKWNPLIDIDNTKDERVVNNINANFFTEIRFMPWLKYRMNFGSGFRNYRKGTWQGSQSTLRRKANPPTSVASYDNENEFQYMIENLLFFDKALGNHTFGATVMQSAQHFQQEKSGISASTIFYDACEFYNLGANLNGKADSYSTGFKENSIQSYMFRGNYSLMDRYLLTATGRWDGSSVLAEGNKWDFFPSFAAAWKIQQESFMQQFPVVSELKLRVGYGVTGNSGVGSYTTMGPLVSYSYNFADAGAVSYIPKSMANPDLGWEKTKQTNIGLDFGVLKNRITGSIEYYQSNTSDILMTREIPVVTGYPNIMYNIGKMKNQGVEISISTVNIHKGDFKWSTDLNWSKNNEEIVELLNGKNNMSGNNVANYRIIGQPLDIYYTYDVDGLWQNTEADLAEIAKWTASGLHFLPGQYKPVEHGTPDYKLTEEDKIVRGSKRPDWVAGMGNTFNYKNFELNFFVYARIGQEYFADLQPGGSSGGSFIGYVRHADADEFWSPTNPGGKYAQPTTLVAASESRVNQATFINDASFVAVRNIGLSYNVPESVLSKIKVKNLQVYTQVLNPFMWGGEVVKAGINPDDENGWESVNSSGNATGGKNNNTMIIKSCVFGLRVGF